MLNRGFEKYLHFMFVLKNLTMNFKMYDGMMWLKDVFKGKHLPQELLEKINGGVGAKEVIIWNCTWDELQALNLAGYTVIQNKRFQIARYGRGKVTISHPSGTLVQIELIEKVLDREIKFMVPWKHFDTVDWAVIWSEE